MKGLQLLIDPFALLTRRQGLMLVAAATAGGVAVSRLGVRFDGFLDLHLGRPPVPIASALADQGVAVLLPAGIAWILLRLLKARRDPAALLIAVGVLRVPAALVAPLLVAVTPATLSSGPIEPTPSLLAVAALALAALGWQLALLVFGLRHASGLSGARLAVAVIALVVSAEVLSKLALGLA